MSMRQTMIGIVLACGVVLLLVGVLTGTGTAQAQNDCGIAGVVNIDRTLSPTECDPYIVTGNLIVDEDITLTMEPGTTLSFDGDWSITVRGTLIAQGTASNKITFTSGQETPAPGDWGQIEFEEASPPATFDAQGTYTGGNVLQHVIVEYGGDNSRLIYAEYSSFYLADSEIRYNTGSIVSSYSDEGIVITNNRFAHNEKWGLVTSPDMRRELVIIQDNIVSNNDSSSTAIGIIGGALDTRIVNNEVINNSSDDMIIVITNSASGTLLFLDNIMQDNVTNDSIVSIRSQAHPPTSERNVTTVSGNVFSNNRTVNSSLAIRPGDPMTVTNNLFLNNIAATGGGMSILQLRSGGNWRRFDGSLLVEQNTFQGNHATEPNGGGAVNIRQYGPNDLARFTDNEFIGNTAAVIPDDPDTPPRREPQDIYNSARSFNDPFNARGNIWGTDDRAEIQARIYDGADDTFLAFVDFEDFRLESPREQQSYNAGAGGSQESADGAVTMTIPGTAITAPTTVTQRILTAPTLPLPAGTTPRYSFSTSASLQDGDILTRFAAPVTIAIDVPTALAQDDAANLNVAYRDGAEWVNLLPCEGCSVTDSQVTVVTDRLGEFALVNAAEGFGSGHQVYLPIVWR